MEDRKENKQKRPVTEVANANSPHHIPTPKKPFNEDVLSLTGSKNALSSKRPKEKFVFPQSNDQAPSKEEITVYFPFQKYTEEVTQMYNKDIQEMETLLTVKDVKIIDFSEKIEIPHFQIDIAKYNEEAKNIHTLVGIEKRAIIESLINKKRLIDSKATHTLNYLMKSIIFNLSLLHKIEALAQHFSIEENNILSRINKRVHVLSTEIAQPLAQITNGIKQYSEKYLEKKKDYESKMQINFERNKEEISRSMIDSGEWDQECMNAPAYKRMMEKKSDVYIKATEKVKNLSVDYMALLEARTGQYVMPEKETKLTPFEEIAEDLKQLYLHRDDNN